MTERGPVVLILGSGPNVVQAAGWHRSLFDHIVVINNAWQVRPDWDALVFPEDFPAHRMPPRVGPDQTLVDASAEPLWRFRFCRRDDGFYNGLLGAG